MFLLPKELERTSDQVARREESVHSKEVWLEEELTKSKMVLSQKMKETTSTLEEYEDYKQTLELTTQKEIEHIRQLSTQAVEEAEAVSLRGLLDAWHCCVCWYYMWGGRLVVLTTLVWLTFNNWYFLTTNHRIHFHCSLSLSLPALPALPGLPGL